MRRRKYVRSKAKLDDSVAKNYVAYEALTLCLMYLHGVEKRFNDSERNWDAPIARHELYVDRSLQDESVYTSDDESKHGAKILNDGAQNSDVESDDECNVDGVSKTIFSDNVDECNVDGHGKETDKHQSEDPFGFYDLLNKLPAKGVRDAIPIFSHPPGFTPKTSCDAPHNVGENL
ncbi:RNA-directed DNA polymerase, eukaryota [Tanacetum coccineum]|uniref:RNA-directed DNA polymerase, eukaryota n=1 Tax=Tanacetum coccineum TaxID=301880 RepID=A0ABQ5G9B6_9ASTR